MKDLIAANISACGQTSFFALRGTISLWVRINGSLVALIYNVHAYFKICIRLEHKLGQF